MNLIDVYIHEVTKRIPQKNRNDISMELRSTIEDMLPENYTETDIKNVLQKLGNPATLAKGYNNQPMYLIGPNYIDLYFTLLKMIIPLALVISFIATAAEVMDVYYATDTTLNKVIDIIVLAISLTFELVVQFAVALTVVFVIMERYSVKPVELQSKEWTPDTLHFIPKKKEISKVEVFIGLLWTAIWGTLVFRADHFIGIYDQSEGSLAFAVPFFNQDVLLSFLPFIILLIGLEVVLSIFKLLEGFWSKKLAIFNAIQGVVSAGVILYILLTPNIINQDFINYDFNLSSVDIPNFHSLLIIFAIIITIVATVLDSYEGFKKSRL